MPHEGEKLAEGELSILTRKAFSILNIPRLREVIEKEVYLNPGELLRVQALIKTAQDSGFKLSKTEKNILKLDPKFTTYQVAMNKIDEAMALKFGTRFGRRTWYEYDWRALEKRDKAYAPQVRELEQMEVWQQAIRDNTSKRIRLELRKESLEKKLNVERLESKYGNKK